MSEETDIDEITNQELAGHELFGQKLEPFSESREIAAQAMGFMFPNIGEEGWARIGKSQAYAGAVTDTAIVLWLCSVPGEMVDRACAAPTAAKKTALDWAIENKLHRVNRCVSRVIDGKPSKMWEEDPRFMEAFNLMLVIIRNAMETEFTVEVEGGRGASIMGDDSPKL